MLRVRGFETRVGPAVADEYRFAMGERPTGDAFAHFEA